MLFSSKKRCFLNKVSTQIIKAQRGQHSFDKGHHYCEAGPWDVHSIPFRKTAPCLPYILERIGYVFHRDSTISGKGSVSQRKKWIYTLLFQECGIPLTKYMMISLNILAWTMVLGNLPSTKETTFKWKIIPLF